MIEDILAYNKQFVTEKGYEEFVTDKYPNKKLAIVTCMDTRLIEAARDLGCNSAGVLRRVIWPLSLPGVISGVNMVLIPSISTFYISQKLGSTGTTLIGDVIESQFKAAYNPNLGAAMSLVLMVIVLLCMSFTSSFDEDEMEGVS